MDAAKHFCFWFCEGEKKSALKPVEWREFGLKFGKLKIDYFYRKIFGMNGEKNVRSSLFKAKREFAWKCVRVWAAMCCCNYRWVAVKWRKSGLLRLTSLQCDWLHWPLSCRQWQCNKCVRRTQLRCSLFDCMARKIYTQQLKSEPIMGPIAMRSTDKIF